MSKTAYHLQLKGFVGGADSIARPLTTSLKRTRVSGIKELHKLAGVSIFTCFSYKELEGKQTTFIEAERYNRQAIPLSNNVDYQAAIEKLDKAISLDSLNAINNKFTVFHTSGNHKEAFQYLDSISTSNNVTAQCLYNLAVIYFNGDYDTGYKVNKDINRAKSLLEKAIKLPIDEREERQTYIKDKINEFLAKL